ncbi:MAG: hypothetical protein J6B32_01130 [Spirochaetaceae bacterium]|nr:hypothetical protein [Spirochaetaceae bacterium]MBO5235703.1 hypothetical protein [Spirochaetaceae bacterium]
MKQKENLKASQFWYCVEIQRRYGTLQRARGCYLYTRSGHRLVDMYQEFGRAILGWGNSKAMLQFKNIMNRGLTGSFITDYSYGLERAIKTLLPEYKEIRWFSSLDSAEKAIALYYGTDIKIPLGEHPVLDTVTDMFAEEMQDLAFFEWLTINGVPRWRPWLDEAWFADSQNIPDKVFHIEPHIHDAVVIVPPLALARSYYIIAFNDSEGRQIPPSDILLPPVMAATTRAIYDLIDELHIRSEKDWNLFDKVLLKYWKRRGPYLLPKIPLLKYKDFFAHCLDCGIVISPNYRNPSIIPYGANIGDFRKLAKNPFEW